MARPSNPYQGIAMQSDQTPIPNTTSQQLDLPRIDNYLRDVMNDPEIPATVETWETHIANLGFTSEPNGTATIAGMALFGKNPGDYFNHAGLQIAAFDGPDKTHHVRLHTTINGPLLPRIDLSTGSKQIIDPGLVEQTLTSLQPFITEQADDIDEHLQHDTYRFYPIQAIREIVINALVHRDWTCQRAVEINAYADRLEIISPGALPPSLTLERMIAGARYPRNNIIRQTMRAYGYTKQGMSIRTVVIPTMRKHNGCDPIFEITEESVTVILPRRTQP